MQSCRIALVTLLLSAGALNAPAQQLAFPGAEGGGRFASGGRGGAVYEVTNLEDSGPGSLREAVSKPGRTIVFRLSGIIHLKSTLRISHDNLTIAGQTAPGDGICIAGYTVSIRASNLIIRYIRCRLGDENNDADDAMNCTSHGPPYRYYHDIIIDHCSMSWAVDEVGSFYGVTNFTLQWCILSRSLYHSVHPKGEHGYGGIWGGFNASFHHNLIADNTSRNPRFCGSRYTGIADSERVDFRNNVIYNWGNINSVYGGEAGHYNMVNNYYKPGPATPGSLTKSSARNKRNRILNYTSYYYAKDAATYPDTTWGGQFYIHGNYVEGYPDVSADNWRLGVQKDGYPQAAMLISKARQDSPFPHPPVATDDALTAYRRVLDSAGAILPRRDRVDRLVIGEARNGKSSYEGTTYGKLTAKGISHPSGIIDSQHDLGGYPDYQSSAAPADKDHDGMPDAWETEHRLNPDNPEDRNAHQLDQGYTNLEIYLHSITGSTAHPMAASGADLVVAKDASGDYASLQAAIDAVPAGKTRAFTIYIKNGIYREKIHIPADKPFIRLIGQSAAGTVISWDDYSGKPRPSGGTFGTSNSATVTIEANDFLAQNLTFENTTGYRGDGPQAVAVNVKGDRCSFTHCRFISGQDTLLTWGSGNRQYFRDCYIDGNTDFIFGNAIAVFDSCNIYPRDRIDGKAGGFITAANTPPGQPFGYVFRDCQILTNHGVTKYTLGRPWQNDNTRTKANRSHTKVVFLNTLMGPSIAPEGWSAWNAGTRTDVITYAEYGSHQSNGKPVDISRRIPWSKQLDAEKAARYYDNHLLFGSWDPCAGNKNRCSTVGGKLAVANLRPEEVARGIIRLRWNLCWPVSGVSYQIFRSTDSIHFEKIQQITIAPQTSYAPEIYDTLPPQQAATRYYYYIRASKAGLPSAHSYIRPCRVMPGGVALIPDCCPAGTLKPQPPTMRHPRPNSTETFNHPPHVI